MRVGIGYDVHKLVKERKLILGGVEIPFKKGLLGHSDADVLCHAIGDAVVGAIGIGDIGKHFPDSWDEFKDISSLLILEKINKLLVIRGFEINNIDSTIIAEKPKMAEFTHQMIQNIANCFNIRKSDVNVKATTTEGLGFCGRGEGISAQATVSIIEIQRSVLGTSSLNRA